eukprot:CAMPEP_0176443968 /NCGR_PEP_ID=MMETSP0127-20121128/22766_1 /TAXON_ID=938130 /ORGANISM="Platyophrya macrostoma, Strain WH" /LENGTH=220 /DNA_ID=CAMNT_0017829353 /DNA_START=32 /DNA_END=694 /DNA_ORIENTATION=-
MKTGGAQPGNATKDSNVIPSTQRADGSWRPERKVREGYVPKEEIVPYSIPQKKAQEPVQAKQGVTRKEEEYAIPGMDPEDYRKMKEKLEGKTNKKKRIRKKKDAKGGEDEAEEGDHHEEEETKQETTEKAADSKKEEEKKKEAPKKQGKQGKAEKEAENADGEGALDETQKKIRNLKKKLKQIEGLEDKKRSGVELNEDELAKIQSKKDVLTQIKDLSLK